MTVANLKEVISVFRVFSSRPIRPLLRSPNVSRTRTSTILRLRNIRQRWHSTSNSIHSESQTMQRPEERPAKKSKERNIVTVTEDYLFYGIRLVPVDKFFEVDQDDLQVVDEIIHTQVAHIDRLSKSKLQNRRQLTSSSLENEDRRVTRLKLAISEMEEVPQCISRLDELECLNLGESPYVYSVPQWISKLKNLKRLSLPCGCMTTEIPDEIWDLSTLEEFALVEQYNRFTPAEQYKLKLRPREVCFEGDTSNLGVPSSINKLCNLKRLDLSNVTFLPEEIANLSALEDLKLSYYKVEYLPSSIGRIPNLGKLTIQDCPELRCLPDSIGQLQCLTELSINYAQMLTRLPFSIGNLKNLKFLRCQGTRIKTLPDSIANIPELEHLNISDNRYLTKLPVCMFNITSLKGLDLYASPITSIPLNIGNLRNLEYLDLTLTKMEGSLPNEIANMTNLRYLGLTNTRIKELPPDLKTLKNLRFLRLDCTVFDNEEDREPIMTLANELPLVECFGDLEMFGCRRDDKVLFNLLFFRKLRSKVSLCETRFPLSLWPYILASNPRVFCHVDIDKLLCVDCTCCSEFNASYLTPIRPTQADVLFRLLVEFGSELVSYPTSNR